MLTLLKANAGHQQSFKVLFISFFKKIDYKKTLESLQINNCISMKIHSLVSVRATEVTRLTLKTFITLKT